MRYPSPNTLRAILESYHLDIDGLTDEFIQDHINDFMNTLDELQAAEEKLSKLEEECMVKIGPVEGEEKIKQLKAYFSLASENDTSYH